MEKIMFFGSLEIAVYWLRQVAKFLDSKGIDYQANQKFLEIETCGVKLVFRSARDWERTMVGRRNCEIVNVPDFELATNLEKTIMELIGGASNESN